MKAATTRAGASSDGEKWRRMVTSLGEWLPRSGSETILADATLETKRPPEGGPAVYLVMARSMRSTKKGTCLSRGGGRQVNSITLEEDARTLWRADVTRR